MRSILAAAATAVVFPAADALVLPERIAEAEPARITRCTDGCAANAADDSARAGIAGQRADGRARACAEKAAGDCAVARRRSAGAKHDRCCGKDCQMFHCDTFVVALGAVLSEHSKLEQAVRTSIVAGPDNAGVSA